MNNSNKTTLDTAAAVVSYQYLQQQMDIPVHRAFRAQSLSLATSPQEPFCNNINTVHSLHATSVSTNFTQVTTISYTRNNKIQRN